MTTPATGDLVAAIDLGSNSFHAVIARIVDGEPVIIDRLEERVRLAAGLDGTKRLSADAQSRALESLARFGERVRALPPDNVRAVGTATLRVAKDARAFLARAREVLGHPIEVIAGREEARLAFLGVAHSVPPSDGARLVVDVGGASTEIILGEGFEPSETDSLHMGCVLGTRAYFGASGGLSRRQYRKARDAALLELEPVRDRYLRLGWREALGSPSGTARAVAAVLEANGWGDGGITPAGLAALVDAMLACGSIDALELPGLKPHRAPVFPGGVAILDAVFRALEIPSMTPTPGALREGVLYDLVGRRRRHDDVRVRTVEWLRDHYRVDRAQAARVERTAAHALGAVAEAWDLRTEAAGLYLGWAARLHEIGVSIAFHHHHLHGAYVLEHSDLAGFSTDDQRIVAALVGAHRRKLRAVAFDAVPEPWSGRTLHMAILLRLAVLLNRRRTDQATPAIEWIAERPRALHLELPEGWLAARPLTHVDLDREQAWLDARGVTLTFGPLPPESDED